MSRMYGQDRGLSIPVQSIYAESSTPLVRVGTRLVLGDRTFRYVKNGAVALTKALMTSTPALVANHVEQVQTAYGAAAGVQQVSVLVTTTTPSKDQYKDGYLVCNKGTGIGQMYRIKSNTAANPTVCTLYDEIETAIAATAELSLIPQIFRDVVVKPTTTVAPLAGVPLIDVTASYYFWAQNKGPCPLITDAGDTIVVGEPVGQAGTAGTAGAVGLVANDGTDAVWGIAQYIATGSEASVIVLNGLGID